MTRGLFFVVGTMSCLDTAPTPKQASLVLPGLRIIVFPIQVLRATMLVVQVEPQEWRVLVACAMGQGNSTQHS